MTANSAVAPGSCGSSADNYIRSVATSPADEIASARALLDAGTINADEFASLKAKALA